MSWRINRLKNYKIMSSERAGLNYKGRVLLLDFLWMYCLTIAIPTNTISLHTSWEAPYLKKLFSKHESWVMKIIRLNGSMEWTNFWIDPTIDILSNPTTSARVPRHWSYGFVRLLASPLTHTSVYAALSTYRDGEASKYRAFASGSQSEEWFCNEEN